MKTEQLKKMKSIIESEDIYLLLSFIANAGFLLPNAYMLVTIIINELKKDNKIPIIALPYLTFLIYSSIKVDLGFDIINEKIK